LRAGQLAGQDGRLDRFLEGKITDSFHFVSKEKKKKASHASALFIYVESYIHNRYIL
jgi:hypothetical protein